MTPNKNQVMIWLAAALLLAAGVVAATRRTREDKPNGAPVYKAVRAERRGAAADTKSRKKPARPQTRAQNAAMRERLRAADDMDEDEVLLSPEMKKVLAELQDCIDDENRAALTRVCGKISRIMRERGEGAVPSQVRAKAVEAIGLFLPESLAELVGFMADSDPEVLESVFDKLDELMNDTTIGDRRLSELLVPLATKLTDEDAIDSMALTIEMNMRNSVKVMTCSKMLDTASEAVVSRLRESIADILEVETGELPSDNDSLKKRLDDWLRENPDDEDDDDLFSGVE